MRCRKAFSRAMPAWLMKTLEGVQAPEGAARLRVVPEEQRDRLAVREQGQQGHVAGLEAADLAQQVAGVHLLVGQRPGEGLAARRPRRGRPRARRAGSRCSRTSRFRLSPRGAGPKPPRPRSSSSLTRKRIAALEELARHPHHQGRDLRGVAAAGAAPPAAAAASRTRATARRVGRGAGGGGRGGPRAGAAAAAASGAGAARPRPAPGAGRTSASDLGREGAQVGLELLGVQLRQAGLEDEAARSPSASRGPGGRGSGSPSSAARAAAGSSSTAASPPRSRPGTTSRPRWACPRSVTSRNGMPALPSVPAFLTAASGSSASTTW